MNGEVRIVQHVRVLPTCEITAKLLVLSVAAFLMAIQPAVARESLLTVRMRDGRIARGELDQQTDEVRLWIKISDPGIVLSSSFPWSEIELIENEQAEISKSDVLKRVAAIKTGTNPQTELQDRIAFWLPNQVSDANLSNDGKDAKQAKTDGPISGGGQSEIAESEKLLQSQRVEYLEIDARAMNWDTDVELDGLLVNVRPFDGEGRVVPVNAQIRFQLFGERYATTTRRTFDASIPFPQVGDWTQKIRKADFGPDGVTVKLPFRRLHPEFNTDLAAHSLLTARLGISGQGTFDASAADVFIRPLSRYRDDLFQRTRSHQRYLGDETTRRH